MPMKYLMLYTDWPERTRRLTDAEKGRLVDAMMAYARGEDPEPLLQGNEQFLFDALRLQLDRDRASYEHTSGIRSAAARHRWQEKTEEGPEEAPGKDDRRKSRGSNSRVPSDADADAREPVQNDANACISIQEKEEEKEKEKENPFSPPSSVSPAAAEEEKERKSFSGMTDIKETVREETRAADTSSAADTAPCDRCRSPHENPPDRAAPPERSPLSDAVLNACRAAGLPRDEEHMRLAAVLRDRYSEDQLIQAVIIAGAGGTGDAGRGCGEAGANIRKTANWRYVAGILRNAAQRGGMAFSGSSAASPAGSSCGPGSVRPPQVLPAQAYTQRSYTDAEIARAANRAWREALAEEASATG